MQPTSGTGAPLRADTSRLWTDAHVPLAVLAGVIGAFVNSTSIRLTQALGIEAGTGGLARMVFAALRAIGLAVPASLGAVGQEAFHTAVGVLAALSYALLGYRLLPGPCLLRGLLFVQVMWLVQVLVVLPWLGKGAFGLAFGPWTPLWSFLLNAVFGLVLGAMYAPRLETASERNVA